MLKITRDGNVTDSADVRAAEVAEPADAEEPSGAIVPAPADDDPAGVPAGDAPAPEPAPAPVAAPRPVPRRTPPPGSAA